MEAQKEISQTLQVIIYLIKDPLILSSEIQTQNQSNTNAEVLQMQMQKFFKCRRKSSSDVDAEFLQTQTQNAEPNIIASDPVWISQKESFDINLNQID